MSRRRRSQSVLSCRHIWTLKRPCMIWVRWVGSRVDSCAFISIWINLMRVLISLVKRRGLPSTFWMMALKVSEAFSKRMTDSL